MARKDRVPNPPKRPQGPQRRATAADRERAERQRRLLFIVAASGLALVAAVLAIVFLTGGDGGDRSALEEAGCTVQSFPGQANTPDHSDVPTLETKPKWNSSPPSSGPHYGQTAVWGFYEEEVPLVQSTHNLEHGGVVVHYGPDVPDSEVEELRSWWEEDPNGLVVAPLETNKDKLTLTAWTAADSTSGNDRGRGWLATCTAFDADAFSAFVEEHRYKGPERVPPELLAPGT